MGAFIICKNKYLNSINKGLVVFEKKGFESPSEFTIGDYHLYTYKKQMVRVNNVRSDNSNNIIVAIGTPIYKQKSYKETLDTLFIDLKSKHFDSSQIYGSFIILYYDGIKIQFIQDDMQQMSIYSTKDGSIISSSFLACAKAYGNELTIDKMACLEKLCTGMITGNNTLFLEISKNNLKYLNNIIQETIVNFSLQPKRSYKNLRDEAKHQIDCLNNELDIIKSLVYEYGADIGLSGGYDSRLLYGLLQEKYGNKLSIHTHYTKGSHEKEVSIATQLANLYGKDLHIVPTFPLQNMIIKEAENTLETNVYLFDGYSDSHYGTFSSTYSKQYREQISNGRKVFFTGISGEIYRNYRKISKPVFTKSYFDTYVFYCHYKYALRNKILIKNLRNYVVQKSFKKNEYAI